MGGQDINESQDTLGVLKDKAHTIQHAATSTADHTFPGGTANWGTVSIYFEVYMRATTGTVYGRLIDSNNAEVVNSEISTTATTFQRLRSASSISFTNALSYRAQFGKAGSDAGEFLGARLVIIPV